MRGNLCFNARSHQIKPLRQPSTENDLFRAIQMQQIDQANAEPSRFLVYELESRPVSMPCSRKNGTRINGLRPAMQC